MKLKYQEVFGLNDELVGIFEPTIGCIPIDEANTDYRNYLESLNQEEVVEPDNAPTSEFLKEETIEPEIIVEPESVIGDNNVS